MKSHSKTGLLIAAVLLGLGVAYWVLKGLPAKDSPPATAVAHPTAVASPVGQTSLVAKEHPSVAAQNQANAVPIAAASTGRKFADIPFMERNAALQEIRKRDLPAIMQAWLDAGRIEHDLMKQGAIATTLSFAMKEQVATPEFLAQVQAFITSKSNSKTERTGMLGILTAAATKESVDLLLLAATSLPDQELKGYAISDVRQVGMLSGAGEKLSPALERTWRETSDQSLLISVAEAMAKIGAPTSIDLLFSAALGSDQARKLAAQNALPEVFKGLAVPPLAARLVDQPPASENAKLAAPLLVRIGDLAAAKTVVNWLQGATESAAPFIRERLFQETRTPAMLEAWRAVLDPTVPFRNEENREAIRAGLKARDAGTGH